MTRPLSEKTCPGDHLPLPGAAPLVWAGISCLLGAAFLLEISLGSVMMPFHTVISILMGNENVPEGWRNIVLLFRLPRAITAMLAGAALGIAGLEMQTLFRNPLAEPYVLGISSGAGLGVALTVMAGGWMGMGPILGKTATAGGISLIASGTVGAVAVLAVVLGIARKVESNVTLLIIGLMFGYITISLVSILMQFALEQQMRGYIAWTFGSFGAVTWRQMPFFASALAAGLALAWGLAKPLNAFLLGDQYSRSMGVNVRSTRFLIISGSSLLAGTVTVYCGPIGFLGIAVPHLCRLLLRTSDHHVLVPAVLMVGAALALVADLISQMPGANVALPLNSVTSLIGAPVVIWIILRSRHAMDG